MARFVLTVFFVALLVSLLGGCNTAQVTTAEVTGQVMLRSTGLPAFNARVQVLSGDTVVGEDLTDPNGRFVISSLRAGTYTLRATYEGHSASVAISLDPGGTFERNLIIDDTQAS